MKSGIFILALLFSTGSFAQAGDSWKIYDDNQVAIIRITVDPADLEWMYRDDNVESDSMHAATVRFQNNQIDETVDSVGFRLRGNTSRSAQKKSFKLSFNTYVKGRRFHGVEKLNLNGEHNDPSIIRSKLCWDFFRRIGMPASRAAHAAVYINDAFYGLYVMVEHVDEEFVKEHFREAGGNLWKCLWPADLTYRGDNPQDYYPYYDETRPYELKTNKDAYDYAPLARLIKVVNNTPDDEFADSLQAVMDVAGVLKYFAMNILTGSWDDYWSLMNNFYLYYRPGRDQFNLIPYDYDNTFGVDWFDIDWTQANPYAFPKVGDAPRPLAERIMQNGRLRNLYTHMLHYYRQHVFDLSCWEERLDSLQNLIAPWAVADTFRTKDYGFTAADFYNSYSAYSYANQHVKTGLKEFVIKRSQSLNSQLQWVRGQPVVYELNWQPRYPRAGDSVFVQAAVFSHEGLDSVALETLYGDPPLWHVYTMSRQPSESSPRVEDADRWTGKILPLKTPGEIRFRVRVRDQEDQELNYPTDGAVRLIFSGQNDSGLLINEFLAKNDHANTDAAGEYDDWLELYNASDQPVSLAGKYLTDDNGNRTKWPFPADTPPLESHDFILIWCDDDLTQSGLHTSFKLAAGGEFIGLVAEDGVTYIDSLSFGPQQADVTRGRFPDGAADWRSLQPTPGTTNDPTAVKQAAPPALKFDLKIFPNPFNQSALLRYYLTSGGALRLTVYNTRGQLVWQKRLSHQAAGYHQIQWPGIAINGVALSSGVFFCRLSDGRSSVVKKLILIR